MMNFEKNNYIINTYTFEFKGVAFCADIVHTVDSRCELWLYAERSSIKQFVEGIDEDKYQDDAQLLKMIDEEVIHWYAEDFMEGLDYEKVTESEDEL